MRTWLPRRLLVTSALALSCSVCDGSSGAHRSEAAAPLRIMPLGDSITEAAGGHASYRYWLARGLDEAGIAYDLVGSRRGVHAGEPLHADFDSDHEGHWGWRADQILERIDAWTREARPDVVLLHIGSNDLFQQQSAEATAREVGALIDRMRRHQPRVRVLLAQLIPARPLPREIPRFNALLRELARTLSTPESPVDVVDQWTGFDVATDTYDGLHPNESGERKMATRWLRALLR